jgi:hypothetical protein
MAYAVNDNIEAAHYNIFVWGSSSGGTLETGVNNINLLWGPGDGNKGMNQDMSSILGLPNNLGVSAGVYNDTVGTLTPVDGVSAGDSEAQASTVLSRQWIGLISAMNRSLYHQNTANVVLSQAPGFGRDIRFITSMSTYMNTIASGMGTARFRATQAGIGLNSPSAWSVGGTGTNQSFSVTRTIEWPSADDARWFFNSGGRIRVSCSATGAGNDRSSAISVITNLLGASDIGYNSRTQFSGASSLGNNVGYWNMTYSDTTFQNIGTINAAAGSVYSTTSLSVSVKLSGDTSGTSGRGKILQVKYDWVSGFGGTGGEAAWNAGDSISITLNTIIDVLTPAYTGGMIQKTWADPSIS